MANLNGIIEEASKLRPHYKDSTKLTSSTASTEVKKGLNKMKDDIKLSYQGADSDAPTKVLTEWDKFTDSSVRLNS